MTKHSPSHLTKDCMNDIVCNYCLEKGHKKSDCEEYIKSRDRENFGRYAEEIFEGRNANREEERERRLCEVRMTINFNNTNDDNEDNVEQTPKQTETKQDFENSNIQDTENNDNENANIESSNLEKDGARSQQLQDTDRKDQDPVEPTETLSI